MCVHPSRSRVQKTLFGVAAVFYKPAGILSSALMRCRRQRITLPIENLQLVTHAVKTIEATLVRTQIAEREILNQRLFGTDY